MTEPAGADRARSWTAAELGRAGTVRPVLTAPAGPLSAPCPDVDPADPAVVELAADLVATMRVSPGCVGLAANQVGVPARVFCLDVSGHPKARVTHGELVLVNAEIVESSRTAKGREGCLSVPHLTGDVRRAERLLLAGWLPGTAQRVTLATDAFEARAVQHELDHLAGLLFLDKVAGAHALYQRQVYL